MVISRAMLSAPAVVMDELTEAMRKSVEYLRRETVERTPHQSSNLRNSFTTDVQAFGDAVFGKVSSPLTYALPIEMGTKPHYPPLEPLINWVEAKLGLYGDEAESAARGIQRKIGRFGTPGYGMAHFALLDGQSTISAEFADAATRITARLADAGTGGAA